MPSTPQPTKITDAGLAAAYDADLSSVQIKIAEVAFGDGGGDGYTPDGTETELVNELARVTVAAYVPLGGGVHKVLAQVQAASLGAEFNCREIGFFLDDGTLFAVWSKGAAADISPASPIIARVSSTLALTVSHTLKLSGVPTGSVTVEVDPDASATLALIAAHENAERPHISMATIVTLSARPTITISSGSGHLKVPFDVVDTDDFDGWSDTNFNFTAPYAGRWRVSGNCKFIGPGTGTVCIVNVYKQNSFFRTGCEMPGGPINCTLPAGGILVPLNAGQIMHFDAACVLSGGGSGSVQLETTSFLQIEYAGRLPA